MYSINLAPFAARFDWRQFYFGKAASSVDTLPKKRHRAFILPTFRPLAAQVAGTLWQSRPPHCEHKREQELSANELLASHQFLIDSWLPRNDGNGRRAIGH